MNGNELTALSGKYHRTTQHSSDQFHQNDGGWVIVLGENLCIDPYTYNKHK